MDKTKQPGISFDGIIVVNEKFWRDYEVDNDAETKLKFNAINNIGETNATVELTTNLELVSNEKTVVTLEVTFVGFFSLIEGKENMEMEDYIENHAAALLFPYVREHISSLTMKAGINPVLLSPINIISLLKNDK